MKTTIQSQCEYWGYCQMPTACKGCGNQKKKAAPSISEMTLEELAEYAVTLEGWDWRLVSGAKTGEGRRLSVWAEGNNGVFVVNRDCENSWKKGRVVGVSTLGAYVDDYYVHEGIDLTDPATLEYLFRVVGGHHHGKTFQSISDKEYRNEAHALIAALAKEVA